MTTPDSPLNDIRAAELAAAQSIAEAGNEADRRIADARRRAVDIAEAGAAEGRAIADTRFAASVAEAERRADGIGREADVGVRRYRDQVEPQLGNLVAAIIEQILPPREAG